VFLLFAACSEYDLGQVLTVEKEATDETAPTTIPPTTPPVDTDTAVPLDTGTGTVTVTVPASAPVYAHTSSTLFVIDPVTGARTAVGDFHLGPAPLAEMVDIAIDLTGRMYGGTYDALYQIDPLTASLSKVCDIDTSPYALAFTSDGALFAGAGPDVVRIDVVTCASTPLATSGSWETSGDLVGLPDGYLYWTVRGEPLDQLIRVDPVTGATFWVGEVGEEKLFGLGYHEDELYGFSDLGSIVRIDPITAQTTVLSSDTTRWWGATTNPVLW
jgi:hypothetical protein